MVGLGVIAGALVFEPVVKGLANWESQWCAYRKTGEYNLDGLNTDDWAEQRDTASSKWSVIRITEYRKPWLPGSGRVIFWTKDENGEHRNEWRLTKWWENRENRRQVSESQAASIESNGNSWPVAEEKVDLFTRKEVDALIEKATREADGKAVHVTLEATKCEPCITDSERAGSPASANDMLARIDSTLETVASVVNAHLGTFASADLVNTLVASVDELVANQKRREGAVTRYVGKKLPVNKEFVEAVAVAVAARRKCNCSSKVPAGPNAKQVETKK